MPPSTLPCRFHADRWAEVVLRLKSQMVNTADLARACTRSQGRNRVGFRALVTCYRPDSGFFEVIRSSGPPGGGHPIVRPLRRFTSSSPGSTTVTTTQDFNGRAGRLVDYVAVYAARSQKYGRVSFRVSHSPGVVPSQNHDTIVHARADHAIALAHREADAELWWTVTGPDIWDVTQTGRDRIALMAVFAKILPWIEDYDQAERMVSLDSDAWLDWRSHIKEVPRFAQRAADMVFEQIASSLNVKTGTDLRI